jgi:hypothetical protein
MTLAKEEYSMEAEKIIKFLIENNILDKVNYADMLEAIMLTDGSDIEEVLMGVEL